MNCVHGGGRKISSVPLVDRKDGDDEDLVLFRELDKRQKDRIASLLQPVSEEFEPGAAAGNYALYRITSRKKGFGYELIGENERNDYDWLKTPPATPLFPSLEMEGKAPELVVQREISILQPLSRFSGTSATATKESIARPKVPTRPITTSHQMKNISSTEYKNTTTTAKTEKQSLHTDFIISNISRDVGLTDTKTKARSRGVSPSLRSKITAAQIYGFSNNQKTTSTDHRLTSAARNQLTTKNSDHLTQINKFSDDSVPPNLRTITTNRSTSATRNRPVANPTLTPPNLRVTTTNNRSASAARNRPATVGISSVFSSQSNQLSNDPPPPPPPPNLRTVITDHRSTSAARNRPVSAEISSGLSSQINQLSNDPPPNLRTTTDRSTSATRGRSQNPSTHATHSIIRKQSRSPSVTRGTKAEVKQQEINNGNESVSNLLGTERGRFQRGIVGSRMVEKVMNARKYSEEREITKSNNTNGFVGRNLMSKSSLDLALKYTEMKRDRTNSGHQGTFLGRS